MWEADPVEYVRASVDEYKNFPSPVSGATSFLFSLASNCTKTAFLPMLQFINTVFTSQEDVSQLTPTMEENLALAEKERTESEADWSRKLCEKTRETDELKMILQSFAKSREEKESTDINLLC